MKNKALIETEKHGLITLKFQDYTPLTNSVIKDLSYLNGFAGKCKMIAEFETTDDNQIIKVKGSRLYLEIGTKLSLMQLKIRQEVIVTKFEFVDDVLMVVARINEGYYRYKFHQIDNNLEIYIVEDKKEQVKTGLLGTQSIIDDLPILSFNDLVTQFELGKQEQDNLRELVFKKLLKDIYSN